MYGLNLVPMAYFSFARFLLAELLSPLFLFQVSLSVVSACIVQQAWLHTTSKMVQVFQQPMLGPY